MKKSFFPSDPIQDRRDEIAKIEKAEYDLPKRTDMTVATNTSKLVKFPLTGAKDFNSNGIATYRNLRSEFVSVLELLQDSVLAQLDTNRGLDCFGNCY